MKHLAVVDLDFILHPDQIVPTERRNELEAWKRRVIDILKDSPIKERKYLRWKLYIYRGLPYNLVDIPKVLEEGELEVPVSI